MSSSSPLFFLPPATDGVCINAPSTITSVANSVVVAVPGAFTPTCSERHIPAFVAGLSELKKHTQRLIVVSVDSPFIMRAWQDALGANDDFVTFASDPEAKWLSTFGLDNHSNDAYTRGGIRAIRSALVFGPDGDAKYIGKDTQRGAVAESGFDAVVEFLTGSAKL